MGLWIRPLITKLLLSIITSKLILGWGIVSIFILSLKLYFRLNRLKRLCRTLTWTIYIWLLGLNKSVRRVQFGSLGWYYNILFLHLGIINYFILLIILWRSSINRIYYLFYSFIYMRIYWNLVNLWLIILNISILILKIWIDFLLLLIVRRLIILLLISDRLSYILLLLIIWWYTAGISLIIWIYLFWNLVSIIVIHRISKIWIFEFYLKFILSI